MPDKIYAKVDVFATDRVKFGQWGTGQKDNTEYLKRSHANELVKEAVEKSFHSIMNELDYDEELYDRLHTAALNPTTEDK